MDKELPQGLTMSEVEHRQKEEGRNELNVSQRRTFWAIASDVCREPMFMLLIGAGAIYLAMGDPHEAIILLGFVVIIMSVTILQERRTEKALEVLKDLSNPRAQVIRDSKISSVPGKDVVRDDIVIISEGERIPADGLLLQAHELAIDESMLTGESEAVPKYLPARLFAGTMVVRGQGLIQVTAVGNDTELGRIGKSLQNIITKKSPLQDEIGHLTRHLAYIGVALCALLAGSYWILNSGWQNALLAGITLAMGILPQEFPVIMIIFLAMGARRIAAHGVLTRHLNAIETLGETTILCVDKTGTLTQNNMIVSALATEQDLIYLGENDSDSLPDKFNQLLEYSVLACEISPHDPMEKAVHKVATDFLHGREYLHPAWSLVKEYELSPELFAMTHVWRSDNVTQDCVAAKGAPEAIASLCRLPDEKRSTILSKTEQLTKKGLRVLGVARAKHDTSQPWPERQQGFDFEFIGLIGFIDPLRPEIFAAIVQCHQAGIRVIMITGDHPGTAGSIAAQAGIHSEAIITGADLLLPGAWVNQPSVNVFARVTPQQKLSIVEALKSQGDVVAMTGDGVNDAPALKAAHIGIAMGKRGTDVAREAASLVLLEDSFTSIIDAIHLGRRIYSNLRQAMVYTLAVHIPIIGLSVVPVLFGHPLLLAPVHIAFLELVIDPACSVVFEAERGGTTLMMDKPRPAKEKLISGYNIVQSLLLGGVVTTTVFLLYYLSLSAGDTIEQARTLAFIALVITNLLLIFACRDENAKWRRVFLDVPGITLWICAGTLAMLAAVIEFPWIATLFGFSTPTLPRILIAIIAAIVVLPVAFFLNNHILKKIRIKNNKKHHP